MRRDSTVEATEAKDDLRAGALESCADEEVCESLDGEVSEAGPFADGGRALMSREALRLVTGPPSPSLSLVKKPDATELASSTDGLRNGLEMLDRDIGLRNDGLVMEKLLGGAVPRIDLRAFVVATERTDMLFVYAAAAL